MTADPTWVPGAAGSGFGSDHLPYGLFAAEEGSRVGVRVGDFVLDITSLSGPTGWSPLFAAGSLEPLLASGASVWRSVRSWVRELVCDVLQRDSVEAHLHPLSSVQLLLPLDIGDYVDFYASEHHASNVGRIFRPGSPPLLPNWRHLPVAYHGRAGTIVVSGTPIRRPIGQFAGGEGEPTPSFGPSRKLDIEAELGFVVGVPSTHGAPIPVADAESHLFGVVGLNDWSARDVQAWEYVPLGPNLSKSFATSISAWITPMEALQLARVELAPQEPRPLPHLLAPDDRGLDITVTVTIDGEVVSEPPYSTMYWSPAQMLAHLTSNGASVRAGDLFGSGTISGPEQRQRGSLLELSWNGTEAWSPDGRSGFLDDGDTVVLDYVAPGRYGVIRLGEVRGTIVGAAGSAPHASSTARR